MRDWTGTLVPCPGDDSPAGNSDRETVRFRQTDWPSADPVWLRRVDAVAAGSGVREACRNLEIALLDRP
jgi:hypothetical protein